MATPNEQGVIKAKEEIEVVFAKYGKGPSGKTTIGALVDETVWRSFRARCLEQGMFAGETLTALMERFLQGEVKCES